MLKIFFLGLATSLNAPNRALHTSILNLAHLETPSVLVFICFVWLADELSQCLMPLYHMAEPSTPVLPHFTPDIDHLYPAPDIFISNSII